MEERNRTGIDWGLQRMFFLLLLLFLFTPVTSARYAFEYFLFQMSGIRKKSLESQRCIASGGWPVLKNITILQAELELHEGWTALLGQKIWDQAEPGKLSELEDC